eukprot:c17806_g1_i1 orf=414-3008(+)
MLEHRESQMRYLIQRVVENTPSNCGDGPFDPHQTVPVDTSACDSLRYKHWHSNPLLKLREVRNDREEPELFSTQRQCNNTKFELENPREDCTQGRKRNSNYCPPKSDCGYLSSKKRYDVMKLVDQIESTCTVSCDFLNHRRSRRCSEDARKHKNEDEKELHRNSSNAEASTAKLIPDYISGDSELTAERMAEGNSRTGSFEDGCTLILDNVATAAESVTKDSTTPDRQAIDDISFSFSPQGCSDQLRQQRDSRNSDYVRQARQSSFQSLTISADHVNPGSTGITEQSVKDNSLAASAASRQVSYNRMGIEEEESWLQLCLGDSYSQPSRLRGTECNIRGAQSESTATLQLLPRKSENDSRTNLNLVVAPLQQNEKHFSANDPGRCRVAPFMDLTPTHKQHIAQLNSPYMMEGATYPRDFRQIQDRFRPVIPHRSLPYIPFHMGSDLPGQRERPCHLMSLTSDQYRLNASTFEDEETTRRIGNTDEKFRGCLYAPPTHSASFNFPSNFTEHRSQNISASKASGPSITPRNSNQAYTWQPPFGADNRPSWQGFQGGLETRMRNYDELGLCIDPGGIALKSSISVEGAQTVSDEWQGMVKSFGTNLHFQNAEMDVSHVGSERTRGNMLPVHNMALFPQTVDRFPCDRFLNWDNRNTANTCIDPVNIQRMTGTALPKSSDMPSRKLLSLGLGHRTGPQSDLSRTFRYSNQQGHNKTLVPLDQQLISEPFPVEKIKITKPSRGQPDVWFSLQAAENLSEDRQLPRLRKTYLRIKDGHMTISLVKKYVAVKLGLTSDTQVDIACRGQIVLPNVSLQQVRDIIWLSNQHQNGENFSFTSSDVSCSSSKDHIMVLTYQRHVEITSTKLLDIH